MPREAQRPLDRDLPVAEGLVREDLRLLGLLEGEEGVGRSARCRLADSSQFFLPRFLRSGLNHLVASMSWTLPRRCSGLRLREHPDVGRDAGVVEHVERQGDDRLEPVVLDDPAADVALALAGVAGEQREPLWTSAMRLPSGVSCFIFETRFARNSIWPSLERVTSEYSGSPACSIMKRGSLIPVLPPIRSRSLFQLLP